MEFYPGVADAIIRSYKSGGLRAIKGGAKSPVMAGFYNTSPADLDLLTGEGCDLLGKEPINFTGSLEGVTDGGPSDDCTVVFPSWVERMANISDGSVDLLAQRWIAALAEEYPGAALDEKELGRGLHDLIEVCRKAVEDKTDVVFVWT